MCLRRVGVDRLVRCGRESLRNAPRAAVVIGAGSAMTIDLVSPQGAFEGGNDLAVFRMCAEALAAAADLLPLAHLDHELATSTAWQEYGSCHSRWVVLGAVGAARENDRPLCELYPDPEVFV